MGRRSRLLLGPVSAACVVLWTALAWAAPDIAGEADGNAYEVAGVDRNTPPPAGAAGADPDPDVAYLRSGTCPNPAPGTLD
ncbi:hypothetical protein, partial [Pengzhenrongella frigida]|uniref:hypothetical protein n=1 Tax=Pengzhenrongella frigida TaxID=1259133 RepID=UPI001A90D477